MAALSTINGGVVGGDLLKAAETPAEAAFTSFPEAPRRGTLGSIVFCPECGAEYRQGVSVCSDCQVLLTSEFPLEPQSAAQPDVELVTVLTTGNDAVIPVAKSLLDDAGIGYLAKNEGFHGLFPVSRFRVEIQVRQDDEEEARQLLADLVRD